MTRIFSDPQYARPSGYDTHTRHCLPIRTNRTAHRSQSTATFIAAALGSVYSKELLDGDRAKEAKKDKQATIKWDKTP